MKLSPLASVRSHHTRIAAFTAIEVMISSFCLLLILGLVVQILLAVTRAVDNVSAGATIQQSSRARTDAIVQDIQAADLVLATYTPTGGSTYTSDRTSTLILRLPAVDSDGMVLSGSDGNPSAYDVVIYRVVTPSSSADGPYALARLVFPAVGSARAASSLSNIIAKNVQSLVLTYIAKETLSGADCTAVTGSNPAACTYALKGVYSAPTNTLYAKEANVYRTSSSSGAATTQGSSAGLYVGGTSSANLQELVSLGQATYTTSGTTLRLSPVPAASEVIDARYSVDPATAVTGGGNAASQVNLQVTLKSAAGTATTLSTETPSTIMTATATLRNRSALN